MVSQLLIKFVCKIKVLISTEVKGKSILKP